MGELQVLGLCRWSYPAAPGAFQKDAGETLEDIRAALYSPERLEPRLFYLEHVVLPCLRAQTDKDFKILLLMGDHLPASWRGRVLQLIADLPQVVPLFHAEGQPHRDVCLEVMRAARDPQAEAVAEFRLDDDDAVAVDFVRRTRQHFDRMRKVFRAEGRLALDFNSGFILKTSADGIGVQPVAARYWTPGLVIYLPVDGKHSLMNFHHAQMWKRITMLCWPRKPMFIRGAHGQNDSSVSEKPYNAQKMKFDPFTVPDTLKDRFGLDLEALDAAWTALLENPG